MVITLPIIPPRTTSQMKRMSNTGGRLRFFKSAAGERAERDYLWLLKPHAPAAPLTGPVELAVTFCWPHNARTSKAQAVGSHWKTTRPDADNLVKQLQDCLVKLQFVSDDGQIARLILEKWHGPTPFVRVELHSL